MSFHTDSLALSLMRLPTRAQTAGSLECSGYIIDQLDISHLHFSESSLMVVTEAIILARVSPHKSSPTMVLILASSPHSIRWREPVLHSRLQTIRPHWGQERGEESSRKQFMHCRLDLIKSRQGLLNIMLLHTLNRVQ